MATSASAHLSELVVKDTQVAEFHFLRKWLHLDDVRVSAETASASNDNTRNYQVIQRVIKAGVALKTHACIRMSGRTVSRSVKGTST